MALLASPDDPDDLWQAVGDEVPAHRMLMQGDVVLTDAGPLLVVTHACSMRRGAELHDTQMAAPIEDHLSRSETAATTGCQLPERRCRM